MKRFISVFICAVLVLGLCGLAEAEGTLFLRYARLTFSVVGESEDIYGGTVPAQDVEWSSEDSSIVTVENGVLTAVGVGTTRITARYEGQELVCETGCLAEDMDTLMSMPVYMVQAPKRVAAEVELDPALFFGDAVFIGDSVTYGMYVNEASNGLLGHPLFLARKNIGVHNFYHHIINLYYQGEERTVEDAVAVCGAKKVFLLLGMNDLGYQTPAEVAEKYAVLIDRIQEKAPGVQIYIQTCLPFYSAGTRFSGYNASIDQFNALMADVAAEKGCLMVDVASFIKDHVNNMASEYCMDFEVHLNLEGSVAWMNMLRGYAFEQMLKA